MLFEILDVSCGAWLTCSFNKTPLLSTLSVKRHIIYHSLPTILCLCSTPMKVQYTGSHNIIPAASVRSLCSLSVFSPPQSAAAISGPQHAEELQHERGDLQPGAQRWQPIGHGPRHGGRRQQEEALQPQCAGSGHRRQPPQPQHVTDQRPW